MSEDIVGSNAACPLSRASIPNSLYRVFGIVTLVAGFVSLCVTIIQGSTKQTS